MGENRVNNDRMVIEQEINERTNMATTFNPIIQTTPTQPNGTMRLNRQAAQIVNFINQAFGAVRTALTQATSFVWNATNPQDALSAFTAINYRASDLFVLATLAQLVLILVAKPSLIPAVIAALGADAPQSLVPDGWTYVVNNDTGAITLTPPVTDSTPGPTPTPTPTPS